MKKILLSILLFTVIVPGTLTPVQAQVTLLPQSETEGDLGSKIQTGDISLTDIPAFIAQFINFGLIIAGSVSMLFLVIGGYRYLIGGVMQSQREQGKNTIIYAIIGLVVTLLSWAIVNTIQLLVT